LPIGPAGVVAMVLIGVSVGGCSISRYGGFASGGDSTGSIGPTAKEGPAAPTETDLAFARNAASDVLTRGDKDASQPWENPETGARGSVTPLAQAYSSEGRTCRDFLASYVKGDSESWLQGAACQTGHGQWEIHTLKRWRQS
jgi:outer membrane surface antigen